MIVRNVYRDGDEIMALTEDGEVVELCGAERTFYARPHEALDTMEYEEAPGGWLRVTMPPLRSDSLADVVEKWRKRGVEIMEADVRPVDRALADLDVQVSGNLSYAMIDIETAEPPIEVLKARDYARFELLSFAYRTSDGKRGCVLADARTPDAERSLLLKLAQVFARYDLVLAWNGGREYGDGSKWNDGFDFPVIRARCKALGIAPIDWWRCAAIDHMGLYDRKFLKTTDGGDRASLALDAVARANGLDAGKVDLKTQLRGRGIDPGQVGITAAYENAPDLLIEYNLRDVDLMWGIEEATGYLDMHLATCQLVGMLPRSDSMSPTRTMDALMLRKGSSSGHHWPTRVYSDDDTEKDKILGAAVMAGEPGLFTNLAILDVGALYPSLIRALNLGPDTLRDDGPIRPLMTDPKGDPTDEVIACFAGHDEPGQIPGALELMLSKRATYDERMQGVEMGTPAHDNLKRLSNACKVATNAFYGIILQQGSRFFNAAVGSAVTSTGRMAIRAITALIEERGYTIRIQDTDSAGFECDDPDVPAQLEEEINTRLFPDLMAKLGVPREVASKILKIKHEETYSRILVVRTKGYAGIYSTYKGQCVPEGKEVLDLVGLECVKGSTIKCARELQREIVLKVLRGDAPGDVRAWIERTREEFMGGEILIDEVLFHTSIGKKLDEYKTETPHVRVAREYEAAGMELEGGKVRYWMANGEHPMLVDEWDQAKLDRAWYWDKQAWPPSQRVLEAAWPEQNWDMSTGAKQDDLFGSQPSRKVKKRRRVAMAEIPAEVVVRIDVPPDSEATHATRMRDRLRINRVHKVADACPGEVPLVVVMVVAGRYETRLTTNMTVDPAARDRLRTAAIIPGDNIDMFGG